MSNHYCFTPVFPFQDFHVYLKSVKFIIVIRVGEGVISYAFEWTIFIAKPHSLIVLSVPLRSLLTLWIASAPPRVQFHSLGVTDFYTLAKYKNDCKKRVLGYSDLRKCPSTGLIGFYGLL